MNLKFTLNHRNRNPEGAALVLTGKQSQISSVSFCYPFRYGKPKAAATGLRVAGIISSDKRLEHAFYKMSRYADAVIAKINQHIIILHQKTYRYQRSFRIVPHRIVCEVLNNTVKPVGIKQYKNTILRNVELIFKAFAFQLRHKIATDLPDILADICFLQL